MRKIAALTRASWLEATSYRVKMLFTFLGLLGAVLPFFFVARALQPVMEQSIAHEGGQYLAFVVVGIVTFGFLRTAIGALPEAIGGALSTGTLEALLGTPTRLPTLLTGMVTYAFLWRTGRTLTLLAFAWLMGAHLIWARGLLAAAILALIVFAHLGFAVFAASLIVAFRASGPLEGIVLWVSTVFGGVYYPTTAIPSWLAQVSTFIPLTYGLRALRRALLEPEIDWSGLAADIMPLTAVGVCLFAASLVTFWVAVRHARRAGTLAQY